ncbi:MAG: hypothetical protein U1F58_05845 [Burkholderiales bacterium]
MFYRIVLQGHVAQGANVADVKHQFTRVTGLPPSVTERLFGSTPNVIKRQVPQADAERIVTTLRAIGASVTLEPDFQGPSAGGLDPVTVPAIPSYRQIDLRPDPSATAPAPPSWRRHARKLTRWALPVGSIVLLVAAALYFAPEFEAFVRDLRKPSPTPNVAPARKAPADAIAASEAPAPSASHVHGPWRCTNQRNGSSTYWHFRADGTLAYLGDDLMHGDVPILGPDIPGHWTLDGIRLRLEAGSGASRQFTLDRLTLTQLDYFDASGDATRCSRP